MTIHEPTPNTHKMGWKLTASYSAGIAGWNHDMKTGKAARQWEKVHVFISSTFNDMHAERDYLVKRVFPDLQDWCERRKLRLVDIDLRWGVTEADASSKRAVQVYLERINETPPTGVPTYDRLTI